MPSSHPEGLLPENQGTVGFREFKAIPLSPKASPFSQVGNNWTLAEEGDGEGGNRHFNFFGPLDTRGSNI